MDHKQRQLQEQQVLYEEMKSLPRGASVFKQQQNSLIYFKANKDKVFEECKKTLDSLTEEYKQNEISQSDHSTAS